MISTIKQLQTVQRQGKRVKWNCCCLHQLLCTRQRIAYCIFYNRSLMLHHLKLYPPPKRNLCNKSPFASSLKLTITPQFQLQCNMYKLTSYACNTTETLIWITTIVSYSVFIIQPCPFHYPTHLALLFVVSVDCHTAYPQPLREVASYMIAAKCWWWDVFSLQSGS